MHRFSCNARRPNGVYEAETAPRLTMFWSAGANPAEDGTNHAQNFSDMVSDPAGTFYVSWIGSRDGLARRGLGMARSRDFGVTWEFSGLVDDSSCACCWNRMIAPRAGEARVLYRDHGIRDMALATTRDHGATWSLGGTVGEFGWAFDGCPHVGGGIGVATVDDGATLHALVWTGHEERHGLYRVRSDDDGATWTDPLPVGGEAARHADLGASGSTVVAAWDEAQGIWTSTSYDNGATWSPALRVSPTGATASHPIVVDTGGRFLVFWTARGEDAVLRWESKTLGDGVARSTDQGSE